MTSTNSTHDYAELQASVYALGAAAREYQAALRLARTGAWGVRFDRLRPVDGEIIVPGREAHRPHDMALFEIADKLGALVTCMETSYEDAALLYAYGATWAAHEIIQGRAPNLVEVRLRDSIPAPGTRPVIGEHLTRWAGRTDYARALGTLLDAELALEHGSGLASEDDLADHEVGEMHDALIRAEGLADAAYAFGVQAERSVHFAINVIAREIATR
ncbi:hypothetical protein OIE66_40580 [Nonomuraea sp. NBC_01738]|uniref:hypothetical protein n=1 Tax=Nonomuraea sp. NBC_01738 TaxID=2976003 RepID=UPI002E11C45A|nr:hypothetical protein OIE66_40580 [Nonomuraea sp. NBC_01738]